MKRAEQDSEKGKILGYCIMCGGKLKSISVFRNFPQGAQVMPYEKDLSDDRGIDINLSACPDCGLVQLDNEPVNYYKYTIRAGINGTMRRLRQEDFKILFHYMEKEGVKGRNILEPGAGRGEFSKLLTEYNNSLTIKGGEKRELTITATEYNPELYEKAKETLKDANVLNIFPEGGLSIEGGPFDAFMQFNFLEHQPDPGDMLDTIRKNLKEGAIGLVTVPSLEYILEYSGYYELLRDHLANYTEETLRELFVRHGFSVLEISIINEDTLRIIVKNEVKCETDSGKSLNDKISSGTETVNIKKLLDGKARLLEEIRVFRKEIKGRLSVWGASHQGFTILSSTELKEFTEYIIDSAPFKAGRYSPSSHIPIYGPSILGERPVENILITAPGYTGEIKEIIRRDFPEINIYALRRGEIEKL